MGYGWGRQSAGGFKLRIIRTLSGLPLDSFDLQPLSFFFSFSLSSLSLFCSFTDIPLRQSQNDREKVSCLPWPSSI